MMTRNENSTVSVAVAYAFAITANVTATLESNAKPQRGKSQPLGYVTLSAGRFTGTS